MTQENKNKIRIMPIILTILIGLLIGLSIFTFLKIKSFKSQINELQAKNINLSSENSNYTKEIEKLKNDNEISNSAGLLLTNIVSKVDELYNRYDKVFVDSYNYCLENVSWDYIGLSDMKWFLTQQKQIQSDYTTLYNQITSLNN